MDEERRKVLELVAAGTVTPEQGNRLLEALAAGDPAPPPTPAATVPARGARDRKSVV